MSAGLLLLIAGTWLVTQVLGGDALRRLGLTGNAPPFPDVPGPGDVLSGAVAAGREATESIWRLPIDWVGDIARRVN